MQWRTGGMVVRLLLINVAVFVALIAFQLVLSIAMGDRMTGMAALDRYVVQWLRSTSDLGGLVLKPWTVFTYMFVHIWPRHICWNM